MEGEGGFHEENIEKNEKPQDDICVLLLDSDVTGLMDMSEKLRNHGCRVVATTRVDDLPRIINNEKIDFVLAESHLAEMNKFELLEKLKTFFEIPVIDEHSKGIKRKERVDADTEKLTEKEYSSDQKMPKLICADDLGVNTLEDFLNAEEAKNEGGEPTETKKNGEGSEKEKPEQVYMADIIEEWASEPVTDFAACVGYEFEELDFPPLVSLEDTVDHGEIPLSPQESSNKGGDIPLSPQESSNKGCEIPLSPQESSNKGAIGQLRVQNPQRASDQELMDDGISLADLESDPNEGQSSFTGLDFHLQEGKGSTSELKLIDEIYTDFAELSSQLKP